jgi:amino acid adenylation domain-containing protein
MTGSRPSTLVELFERTATRYADEPAAADGERELTYQELAAEVDAMARVLAASGIGAGDRVGIYLARGIPVLVSVLAILRVGAAYLPVDDVYPAERRDHMLAAGEVKSVVVGPGWQDRVSATGAAALEWGAMPRSVHPLPPAPRPPDAASVLFTSGSTGRPRGVVLEHRQLVAFALDPAICSLRPGDRTAQTSSISFDTFSFEMWRSFAVGAQVVVLPGLPDLIDADIGRELRRHRITAMLVPAIALNHVSRYDREAFASLRVLCSGGDVLLPSTCREMVAGGFNGELFNLYGPTEATVAVTSFPIKNATELADQVPIGYPFSWTRLYVLDGRLARVPAGEVGELYVAGAGVGRCYLGMPAETARRFVADPFAADGSRMYATGDSVRRGGDGVVEFIGRNDSQVKIRGYRVDPQEVERILCRFPDLVEAAVIAVADRDLRRLVAFVIPADESFVLRELRAFLVDSVPDYLIPAQFVVIDAMPSDPHGKRDWQALRQIWQDRVARRRWYVAPRTETERRLATAWEDLLAVESIGVRDDFFELGGHSLLTANLRQFVRRMLRTTVEPESLFEHSVLEDQARMIDRLREGSVA